MFNFSTLCLTGKTTNIDVGHYLKIKFLIFTLQSVSLHHNSLLILENLMIETLPLFQPKDLSCLLGKSREGVLWEL